MLYQGHVLTSRVPQLVILMCLKFTTVGICVLLSIRHFVVTAFIRRFMLSYTPQQWSSSQCAWLSGGGYSIPCWRISGTEKSYSNQVQHIESVVWSIHHPPTVKAFIVGYTKDREFKSALHKYHDKYMMKNGLVYAKTDHAVATLWVPADDRLIIDAVEKHHDGNTAAHPGARRTQLKVDQWYYYPTLEK